MSIRVSVTSAALTATLALAGALGAAGTATADSRNCVVHGNHIAYCGPARHGEHHHHDDHVTVVHRPYVGERLRGGEVVTVERYHRLPPLPPHQEYRVIDNRVVRVDPNTLEVLAVVGLASALLANN